MSWAFEVKCDSGGEKAVLLALANHADAQGECYPGQERLSLMASVPERSVRRHLANLEARGLLVRTHRYSGKGKRTSDLYRLAVSAIYRPQCPVEAATTGQIGTSLPVTMSGEPSVEPSVDDDGGSAREAAPLEIVSEKSVGPTAEPSKSEAVAVIAAFDAAIAEVWGEGRQRLYPASTDIVTAGRFLASGVPLDMAREVFRAVLARKRHSDDPEPPSSLKYCEKAIGRALQERNRPAAEVVPFHPGSGRRKSYSETNLRGMAAALAKRQAAEPDAGG